MGHCQRVKPQQVQGEPPEQDSSIAGILSRWRECLGEKAGKQGWEMSRAFCQFDKNRDGIIDPVEFEKLLKRCNFPPEDVRPLFKWLDKDGNGFIDYTEFQDRLGQLLGPQVQERTQRSTRKSQKTPRVP